MTELIEALQGAREEDYARILEAWTCCPREDRQQQLHKLAGWIVSAYEGVVPFL